MKKIYILSLLAMALTAFAVPGPIKEMPLTKQKDRVQAATQANKDKWTVISTTAPSYFRDLQFLDENYGWGITDHSLWKTHEGGHSWTEVKPAPAVKLLEHYEPQETFEQLAFFNQTEGWVLEGDYLIHTTDGGASWQRHVFENVIVTSFHFLDSDNGWFVGQLLRSPVREGEVEAWYPIIYGTKDGGKKWARLFKGPEDRYPIWDLRAISPKNIWAVGAFILHSSDGGATWDKVCINDREGVNGMPVEVRFLDSNTGWILTNSPGGYLFTNDGGKTWEARGVPAEAGGFTDLVYISPTEARAVAKNIYTSSDSGKTWTKDLEGDYFRINFLKREKIIVAVGKTIAMRAVQ